MCVMLFLKFLTSFTILLICIEVCYFLFLHYKGFLLRLGIYSVYKGGNFIQPSFKGRLIGFCGDSVTFGYSDDKDGKQLDSAWIKQIPKLLGCDVVNCGINSATVLNIDGTPKAWAKSYNEIPKQIDILGLMIGINDCYRKYPLGLFEDRCDSTFYGGLHKLIKGLTERFPIHNKKHIFIIIYPNYEAMKDFDNFTDAMYKVANYYSIPVCDLSLFLGASPYNDERFEYWRKYQDNDFHNPHPTEMISHAYATAIANYINSHFLIE